MSERPSTGKRDRPSVTDRGHRRHAARARHSRSFPRGPAEARPRGIDRPPGQVEIEEHRLAVARQENVRWLDVHVHQAAVMSVLEAVGEAGTDPGNGLDVRGAGERPAIRPLARETDRQRLLGLVESARSGPSPERRVRWTIREQLQKASQGRPPRIRHAEDPLVARRQHLLGIKRHDVHVLQPRQREMFLLAGRSSPSGRPAGRPASFARRGRRVPTPRGRARPRAGTRPELPPHSGKWARSVPAASDAGSRGATSSSARHLREPIHDLGQIDLQAGFLTQANFFMDQAQCCLGTELGMAVEKCLGGRLLPPPPGGHHLFHEPRRERGGAGTGGVAGVEAKRASGEPEGRHSMAHRPPGRGDEWPYEGCRAREKSESKPFRRGQWPVSAPGRRGCGARYFRAGRSGLGDLGKRDSRGV